MSSSWGHGWLGRRRLGGLAALVLAPSALAPLALAPLALAPLALAPLALAPTASAAAPASASPSASASASPVPKPTLRAAPSAIPAAGFVRLVGTAYGAAQGAHVGLARSLYPFTRLTLVRSTRVGPRGRFQFVVHPDRDVRYIAWVPGIGLSRPVNVTVGAPTRTIVQRLPLGRLHVAVLVFHPADLPWSGTTAHWRFGAPGASVALDERTAALGPHITVLSATVALPAGWASWSVCFSPPEARALANPRRPAGCSGRGYHGSEWVPFGYPGPGAVARAAAWLSRRAGRTGFAVVDSEGRLSGVNLHDTWVTASVVKAMLLTEYLRRLDARGQHYVDSYSDSILYPMIHVSDNSAASAVYNTMGDGGLYALAAAAHMSDFSVNGSWGNAQLSPADQAEFFFHMEQLLPREFVGYADHLLSTIAGYESWGIPAVARPLGYTVYFKGGWRGTALGQLVHQVGRLHGHNLTFAFAIMTDGDPSMGYGIATIEGVTGELLSSPP